MSGVRLTGRERHAQILEAAARLFAAQGYERTTTQTIAAAAGITEPVIYRHFESKAALYCEVLDAAVDEILDTWAAIRAHSPPEQWLAQMGDHYRRKLRQGSWSARLQIDALAHAHAPEGRRAVHANYRRVHKFLRETILEAQRRGALPSTLDPEVEAWDLPGLGFLLGVDHLVHLISRHSLQLVIEGRRARLQPTGLPARLGRASKKLRVLPSSSAAVRR